MIKITDLDFGYENNPVFNNLNLTIDNKVMAVCAPSGSGKTTLLRLIMGIEKPQSGKIEFLSGGKLFDPRFSAVFQEDRLIEQITVMQNFLPVLKSNSKKESMLKTNNICKMLHINDLTERMPSQLSGGQKRRVAIARALIADYDILVLDEPFNGLDEDIKQITAKTIKANVGKRHILLVSHNEGDIRLLNAERILLG